MTNVGERVGERGPSCTTGGNVGRYSHCGKQCGDPWKKQKRLETPKPHFWVLSVGEENARLRFHLHRHVYNSQDMGATSVPIRGCMDNRNVIDHADARIHSGMLFPGESEGNSALCNKMGKPCSQYAKWNVRQTVTDTTWSHVYVEHNRNLIRSESKPVMARGAWAGGRKVEWAKWAKGVKGHMFPVSKHVLGNAVYRVVTAVSSTALYVWMLLGGQTIFLVLLSIWVHWVSVSMRDP